MMSLLVRRDSSSVQSRVKLFLASMTISIPIPIPMLQFRISSNFHFRLCNAEAGVDVDNPPHSTAAGSKLQIKNVRDRRDSS